MLLKNKISEVSQIYKQSMNLIVKMHKIGQSPKSFKTTQKAVKIAHLPH